MRIAAFEPAKAPPLASRARLIVDTQLRGLLDRRSTRFAAVGLLMVAASLSTLVPTPEGVDLAWMFIVPVAISAIAGGLREGLTAAAVAALVSAFYATAAVGEVDVALISTVFLGRVILFGITAIVLGAFAEAHQSMRSHLSDLAFLDPLTKVSNVSRFYEEIGVMEKTSDRFAVLLVDLDDLKGLNDRFGHQLGSAAIQTVADCLRHVVRASDCVARFGGDEFVVILKDADRPGATVVVDRLRTVLAARTAAAAVDVDLTVSVGVALFGDDGTTSEELLAAADEAMYRDKRTRKASTTV